MEAEQGFSSFFCQFLMIFQSEHTALARKTLKIFIKYGKMFGRKRKQNLFKNSSSTYFSGRIPDTQKFGYPIQSITNLAANIHRCPFRFWRNEIHIKFPRHTAQYSNFRKSTILESCVQFCLKGLNQRFLIFFQTDRPRRRELTK